MKNNIMRFSRENEYELIARETFMVINQNSRTKLDLLHGVIMEQLVQLHDFPVSLQHQKS